MAQMVLYLMMSNRLWIDRIAIGITVLYVGYQLYMMYQTVNTCYEHYGTCSVFYDEYSKIVEFIDTVENMTKSEIYIDTEKVKESINYLRYYFTDDVSMGFSLVAKLSIVTYVLLD
jgi:hypothetical protein